MSNSIDFELIHEDNTENAILLFHGLTGSPFEMKKYGVFLHNLGYDVYCYCFPGHGNRLDEINVVTCKDWCDFAQDKYDKLRGKYKNFFVSGLCLGAVMSLYLAENNSDITGVVALSTTLFLDGFCLPKLIFLLPLALSTILRFYYTFPEDSSLGIKNEDTRRKLARIMARTTVGMDNYPLSCVRELTELSKNVRKNLSKINAPIILIHSKFDNLTSTKGAKLVYKKVSSANKKYVEIENSYHMILYDNEKVYVMDTVKEFLESLQTEKVTVGV